jgi:hypothetical protein
LLPRKDDDMRYRKIFFDGRECDEESEDLQSLVDFLSSRLGYMHGLHVDDIIEFFDEAGKRWSQNPEMKRVGAGYLAEFISRKNVSSMMDTALRNRLGLDGFVKLNGGKMLYHAQPRGLAVHWIAGNVPILGMFSIIQSMLTKNVSIVKASSKSYRELLMLLDSLRHVDTGKIRGEDIIKTLAVILVDRDAKGMEELSLAADLRIAWGGHDAVQSIMSLRKRFSTEDIIFGPKYSYALIGKDTLHDYKRIAQRLAVDVSVFDQYACSSPHTVFVEKGGSVTPLEFAKELGDQLSMVARTILPKGAMGPGKVMDMLRVKSMYQMAGEVFSTEKNEWAVIYSEEEGLAEACFSRVVFVRPIEGLEDVGKYNDRHKQTLGLSLGEGRLEFADEVTLHGIDRCPPIGQMSLFESPWDGMFSLDRMVRWVTCYE